MTFQQLKYLLEVARTRSVALAAKNLFVSSSSISIAVGNLEKELGFELFFRSAQGLVPTQRGQKILDHAERICRSYDQLHAVNQDPVRTIRINCNGNPIISRAIAQVISENRDRQDLRFETTAYPPGQILHRIINNELDISLSAMMHLALGYWEKQTTKMGLHRQILKTIPACIQMGPGHRLYDARRILPHELKNETLLDNPHSSLSQSPLFSGTVYTAPEKTIYIAHIPVQEELLLRGIGYRVNMMPPLAERQNTLLRSIPLEGVNYCISAITNPQTPKPPEISRLLQILKKELDAAYPEEMPTPE